MQRCISGVCTIKIICGKPPQLPKATVDHLAPIYDFQIYNPCLIGDTIVPLLCCPSLMRDWQRGIADHTTLRLLYRT